MQLEGLAQTQFMLSGEVGLKIRLQKLELEAHYLINQKIEALP